MDVKDAEKARRQGDYKREFAIRKAHLQDLFYNKAQVVTLLKKQEVCIGLHFLRSCVTIISSTVGRTKENRGECAS